MIARLVARTGWAVVAVAVAAWLALVEAFWLPLRAGAVPIPLSVLAAVAGNLLLVRLAHRLSGSRAVAVLPGVVWLVVALGAGLGAVWASAGVALPTAAHTASAAVRSAGVVRRARKGLSDVPVTPAGVRMSSVSGSVVRGELPRTRPCSETTRASRTGADCAGSVRPAYGPGRAAAAPGWSRAPLRRASRYFWSLAGPPFATALSKVRTSMPRR